MTTKTDSQPSYPIEAQQGAGGDCVSRLVLPSSLTPETDAATYKYDDAFAAHGKTVVRSDVARKLERERNEARAMARDMRNQLEKASTARLIFPWENAEHIHPETTPQNETNQ